MISAEELLKPISEANPCGDNVEYDPAFVELDTLILGKPETQFSPAEDPDWRMVHQRCLELSVRSKDLRLATKLCLTGLKLDGLPALSEGLALLKKLDKPVRDCHSRQLGHLSPAKLRDLIELLQAARKPHEEAEGTWA